MKGAEAVKVAFRRQGSERLSWKVSQLRDAWENEKGYLQRTHASHSSLSPILKQCLASLGRFKLTTCCSL